MTDPDRWARLLQADYISIADRALRLTVLVGAALFWVVLLYVVCSRMSYPFELEWIEGSSLDTVARVLDGQQIYVEPSLEYNPYLYTPLYFWVSALFTKVFGLGFLPLRLVSILCSVGSGLLVYAFVRRETASRLCAFAASGVFAGTFQLTEFWFDIGRVDCMFSFLVLATAYALRFGEGWQARVRAAFLLYLAFLTKQSALFAAVPFCAYCVLADKRWNRAVFAGTFFALAGVSVAVFNWRSDGWFWYHVFELPSQHPLLPRQAVDFWKADILPNLAIAVGLSVAAMLSFVAARRWRDGFFYLCLFGAMVVGAWSARAHSGSGANVVITAASGVALLFGMGFHQMLSRQTSSHPDTGPGPDSRSRFLDVCILALAAVQLGTLVYRPQPQIPSAADREAGFRLVETLRGIDGDIFMSYPAWLPDINEPNKKLYSDGGSLADVFRSKDQKEIARTRAAVDAAIRSKRFAAIVISEPHFGRYINSPAFIALVREHYEDRGLLFDPKDPAFKHIVGIPCRPTRLFVAK